MAALMRNDIPEVCGRVEVSSNNTNVVAIVPARDRAFFALGAIRHAAFVKVLDDDDAPTFGPGGNRRTPSDLFATRINGRKDGFSLSFGKAFVQRDEVGRVSSAGNQAECECGVFHSPIIIDEKDLVKAHG